MTSRPGYTVLRKPAVQSVAFFPVVGGGKYHASHVGQDHAACSLAPLNGRPVYEPVVVEVGQTEVHPIVCKRCLRYTQSNYPGLKS